MRAHNVIVKGGLDPIMRPVNVSLCQNTWEIAKTIPNFSAWVRARLEERATNNKKRWDRPKEEWIIYDAKGRIPEEKVEE